MCYSEAVLNLASKLLLHRCNHLQGPTVFKQYLNRPEDTAAAFDEEGWFKTGDVAVINEFGEYRLSGRMSADIIKVMDYQ